MKLVSARGAQKTREDSKKLQMYSKQWLPGDTLRIFIPVYYAETGWEIAVGAVWGHSVNDFDGIGLKTNFIPSLTAFDDDGQPIGQPDITYQFSLIAKTFIDGQKAAAEAAIQKKPWPTEAARSEALRTLENKYDTKNNMKAIKPAIGRAQYYISTEVICVKMVNDSPVMETLTVVSMPLSSQRINQLYTILGDRKYEPMEGEEFFEIEWKYPANPDKGQSAKASAPSGLTAEYRLQATHPDAYKAVSGMFNLVSRDADSIVKRATRKIDESKIRAAISSYAIMNSGDLDTVPEESEELLIKHADLVHELALTRCISNQELIGKINAEFEKIKASKVPETIPDLAATPTPAPAPAPAVDLGATTVDLGASATTPVQDLAASATTPAQDLAASQQINPEAPSIGALMNNNNYADMSESELGDIDLSMM